MPISISKLTLDVRIWLCAVALLCSGCNVFLDANAHVKRAEAMITSHDYRAAVIELQNALQSEPKHATAQLLLAKSLLALGDAEGARKALHGAISNGIPPAQTASLYAQVRLELLEFSALLEELEPGKLALSDDRREFYRGQALLGLKQYEAALNAFEASLKLNPRSTDAHTGAATALLGSGKYSAALNQLKAALSIDPQNSRALVAQGTVYAVRGECTQAIAVLAGARKAKDDLIAREQVQLLALLADTQLACGRVEDAASTQRALQSVAGQAPITQLLAGRIAMARQDYANAVVDFQRMVNEFPDFVPARLLLGAALLAQGNLNQAEAQLADVLQRAPESTEARRLLAQARLRLQRPSAAIDVLSRESDANDEQLDALLEVAKPQLANRTLVEGASETQRDRLLALAQTQIMSGDPEAALQTLQSLSVIAKDVRFESLKLSALIAARGGHVAADQLHQWLRDRPDTPEMLNLAAAFYVQQGDFQSARQALSHARQVKSGDLPTLVNSARVEMAARQYGAAAEWLKTALNADASYAPARLGLAQLAIQRGDLGDAAKELRTLCSQHAAAVQPRLLLAKVQIQSGQRQDADATVRELTAMASDRPEILDQVGLLYLQAGRFDDAIPSLLRASAADPKNPLPLLNLSTAQLALNQTASARASLERALELKPAWPHAVRALAFLEIREGHAQAATDLIEHAKTIRTRDALLETIDGDTKMVQRRYADAADAYSRAARWRATAELSVKAYRARLAAGQDDATVPLEEWLGQHPDDRLVRMVLADGYQTGGRVAAAAKQYETLAARFPEDASVLNNLAWLYKQQGDARALAIARRAYDLEPKNPAIADTYGWTLVESGKVAEGATKLAQALSAQDVPEIRYHYAVAQARLGNGKAAREHLQPLVESMTTPFPSQKAARELFEQLSAK